MFTYPVSGRTNVTQLNGTLVQTTSVEIDDAAPWQIALKSPNTSLSFNGFTTMPPIPFDSKAPAAAIKAQAMSVTNYEKGNVPDGPVPASNWNGTLFDIQLVPLAFSNALRLTVLPVLAENSTTEHEE